jgi:hypothetical protein
MPHRTDSRRDVHNTDNACEEWDRLRRWRDKKGGEIEIERKNEERKKEVMGGVALGRRIHMASDIIRLLPTS